MIWGSLLTPSCCDGGNTVSFWGTHTSAANCGRMLWWLADGTWPAVDLSLKLHLIGCQSIHNFNFVVCEEEERYMKTFTEFNPHRSDMPTKTTILEMSCTTPPFYWWIITSLVLWLGNPNKLGIFTKLKAMHPNEWIFNAVLFSLVILQLSGVKNYDCIWIDDCSVHKNAVADSMMWKM